MNNIDAANDIKIWPNHTYGNFSIKTNDGGELDVYNVQGQEVATYKVSAGETSLRLPATLSAGVYVCRYVSTSNNSPQIVRLIYQP